MASMSMTVYYIFLIKAELFYILFMETVHHHKLEDATVLGILRGLGLPASCAAVSGCHYALCCSLGLGALMIKEHSGWIFLLSPSHQFSFMCHEAVL